MPKLDSKIKPCYATLIVEQIITTSFRKHLMSETGHWMNMLFSPPKEAAES